MSFTLEFALEALMSMALGLVLSTLVGLPIARLVAPSGLARSLRVGLAPVLGLAALSLSGSWLYWLVPLSRWTCLAHALLLAAALWRLVPTPASDRALASRAQSPSRVGLGGLWLASLALGALACTDAMPLVIDGGLYAGAALHDHARLVFIDSLARHGLPPENPLFSPGAPMPLGYYYLWLLPGAMLKAILHVPAWPIDLGLSWLSYSAVLALCVCLSVAGSGRLRAGLAVLLLGLGDAAYMGLPAFIRRLPGVAPADPGGFQPLLTQARWAPHHVLAAGALALMLFVLADDSASASRRARIALVALLFAFAAGCSGWPALALCLVSPALAAVLVAASGPRGLVVPALAAGLAALLIAPTWSALSRPPCASADLPIALSLFDSTGQSEAPWLEAPLYWFHFLPAVLGPMWVFGLLGLLRRVPPEQARQPALFRWLSLSACLGVLLVCQFVASTLFNNDLGWRANLVAQVLLVIWGGMALAELSPRRQPLLSLLALALLSLALSATRLVPPTPAVDPARRSHHRDFLAQRDAFAMLRKYTRPTARILSNPHGFQDIVPWPINLDFLLFADRDSAYAHPAWVATYCPGAQRMAVPIDAIVTRVFAGAPGPEALAFLRQELGVDALLVQREDPVFGDPALSRGGYFERVHREERFEIYRAVAR